MDNSSSAGRKLSVAMIARDAETTIAAALDSVRAIADEIVVVDTGSQDRTRQVARQRASKLLEFPWSDSFSAARNFALSHTSGDWVLWLDASEQLDRASAEMIRKRLDSQNNLSQAYVLMVQLPPGYGQVDGEEVGRVRLWPIKAGMKFFGRVREQLTPMPESVGVSVETTAWRIKRSLRDVDPVVKAEKARRDIRLAELEISEQGEHPQLQLAQGDAWAALGEPDKAGDWFRRAIAKSLPASTEQLEAYYGLLTTFDGRLNTRDEQIATCLKALETFPLDAQLLCAMGSYLQAQGRLDLACRSYQMAVEHGQINLHTWHLARLAEFAVVCYSLTLDLQGRSVEACQVLRNALSSSTGSERLRRHLIELHIKHNQRRDALAEADQLPLEVLHREPLRNAIRGACLAVQQQWSSATAYLRGAYDAGCRDPICLRWLTSGFMAAGNFDAAEPILHQWQTVAPENPEPARWLLTLAAGRRAAKTDRSATSKADAPSRWIDTTTVGAAPHIGISPMPTDSGLFAR